MRRAMMIIMTDWDEFEEIDGWPIEQVGNLCAACELPAPVNDLGLCARCNAKLDRDLIRGRDWDYSATAFGIAEEQREELRDQVIKRYGAAYELIEPPPAKPRRKKEASHAPEVDPPKRNRHAKQPEIPAEPIQNYTEADVLAAIEAVIRATTKAYGWRPLGDIGQHLRKSFADFDPSRFGCKNLLGLIERHPDRFKIKWSASASKGASQVWIKLNSNKL
jgi:hypothetical protein